MPDRATIASATPRCQAENRRMNKAKWLVTICDMPLHWKQLHEAWACPQHGYAGHNAMLEREEANT